MIHQLNTTRKMNNIQNILILGAGKAGKLLSEDIQKNYPNYRVVGFLDDYKKYIRSDNILGSISDISGSIKSI